MNSEKVKEKLREGLSVFCATCDHYWKARENGVPGDACLQNDCASPLGGGTFDKYKGPINPPHAVCFVCGTLPDYGIQTKGSLRVLAVCAKHQPLLNKLHPTTGQKAEFAVQGEKKEEKKPLLLSDVLSEL